MELVDVLRLPRTVQNARRVQEILTVLARYGAGDVLRRIGLWARWQRVDAVPDTWERNVRRALEELGPTFIKAGQILATRSDLVPFALAHELRRLQDRAPRVDTGAVRQQIERDLGRPLAELFASFDEEPIAAASIAQVHRARLRSGEEVVVKVRRPGLSDVVARDLDILGAIARRIDEYAKGMLPISATGLVAELAHGVRQEVDLRREAGHLVRLRKIHEQDPGVHCARVFPKLCSERILTVEFVEGVRPDDFAALDRLGVDRKELAVRLLRITMTQVLEHGFFHADPHPGNLLVAPGPVITPIDLGLVGRLSRRERDDLLELLAAVFRDDPARVMSLLDRMQRLPRGCDLRLLERDVQEMIDRFAEGSVERTHLADFLTDLLHTLTRHGGTAPSEFFLLARTLAVIEGLVQELAPELDPARELRPVALRLYLERLTSPQFLARDWTHAAQRAARLLQRAPDQLSTLIDQLQTGDLRVEVTSQAQLDALDRVTRATKRMALAILASAGFLGSVLLLFLTVGPEVYGTPLTEALGFAGLAASTLGGLALTLGAIARRR